MLCVNKHTTAPSASPSSVRVRDMTAFTITVQWEMVPCTAQNGEIIGHIVYYWETEQGNETDPMTINITINGELSHGDTMNSEKTMSACLGSEHASDVMSTTQDTSNEGDSVSVSGQQVTLTRLRPSTNYYITVAAYNRAGIGNQSQPLSSKTSGESFWLCHCNNIIFNTCIIQVCFWRGISFHLKHHLASPGNLLLE